MSTEKEILNQMEEENIKQEEFANKTKLSIQNWLKLSQFIIIFCIGHICVKRLESYPICVIWCQDEICTGVAKIPEINWKAPLILE